MIKKDITNIIDNKYDKRLSNFIAAYFLVQALNLFVKLTIGVFAGWDIITRGILIVFLLLCISPIIKRGFWCAIVSEMVLICLFAYTVLSGGAEYSVYNSIMINAVSVFMPMALAVFMIKDKTVLIQKLYIVAWPTQILLIVVLLNLRSADYSMVGGYALVFQLLIILDHFFEKHKWYDLVFVIVDTFMIVVYGSRGPILCIAAMILLYVLFSRQISLKKRIIIIIVIAVITYLLYSNINAIVGFVADFASSLGFKSRSLKLFLTRSITVDSGRSNYYSYYLDIIPTRAVLGYGLVGGWRSVGEYPHHLFIELLLSFGVVFGTIACALVVFLSFKAVTSKNEQIQRLSIILVSYCISLFLSDSFMSCPMFYLLMAMGFSSINVRFRLKRERHYSTIM